MSELTVQVSPDALSGELVTKHATVPEPQPRALQALAAVVLVGLTAALIVLLMNDPGTVGTALIGAALLMCVFALVVWVSAVLQLGIGPKQLITLVKTVLQAAKEANSKAGKQPTPPTPTPTPGGQPTSR